MKIGINKMAFYVPKYYLDMKDLAKARNVDPLKFTNGLLQNKMSVAPLNQDIVSMATNAALQIVTKEDIKNIDMVMFATESSIDQSKAASTHLLSLLGLNNNVRAIELKQACYSITAAIYLAKGHILRNPDSQVLILGSDIARYGINTNGEPTQGAGAVALLIGSNPKVMIINDDSAVHSEDIYDFWRPNHLEFALVDGHYSNEQYKKFFLKTFNNFLKNSKLSLSDLKAITLHTPYSKIGLRSIQLIANEKDSPLLFENYQHATVYNKEVGNIYTGSLYLSLISLLENGNLAAGDKIGMYSYGSGAVAEFFSGTLVSNYKDNLNVLFHKNMLEKRESLDIKRYEKIIMTTLREDISLDEDNETLCQLKSIENQQRKYIVKDVK